MSAQKNTMWSARIRELLSQGYGVEDIALMVGCDVRHVRLEVKILRESGQLPEVLK